MADFQPPPTWALPILVDENTRKAQFNPVWLQWFVDLVAVINASGGGGGAFVHNDLSGLQGGTANQYYHLSLAQNTIAQTLTAGTYTPTLTNTTNLDGSTAYQCQYLRVGATVTVSGLVDANPTAGGSVVLGISLPVASNFGAVEDCAGVAASSTIAGQSAAIRANVANDRAEMVWVAVDTTNQPMYFTFTYQVI